MPVDPLENIIEQWKIIDKQEKANPHGMTHNALVTDTIEYLELLASLLHEGNTLGLLGLERNESET